MAGLDLKAKYVSFIKKTVHEVLPDVDIFIYGSRTQGKAQEYSDIDIALKGNTEILFMDLLALKGVFRDSDFPYKVDIVDLNTLNKDFLKIIEPDLYKIQ